MDSFHTEPVRGLIGNVGAYALPGGEMVRRLIAGELGRVPIQHLTGMQPTDTGLGTVTWEMPITGWLQDRYGIIWGGVYVFFADAVVGTSLHSGLPPGKAVTTSELTLSYIRPATLDAGNLIGRGSTIHLDGEAGLAEAKIEDRHGRLLAHASTRCIVIDLPVPAGTPLLPIPQPIDDPSDPYLRGVPDHVEGDDPQLGDLTPLEVFAKRWTTGELDIGPVARMTGHRGIAMGDGTYEMSWPASSWFSAGVPTMYGGAIAWAMDTAIEGAIFSTLDAGEFNAAMDLQVRYFRPPLLDGSELTVRAEVQHRGHRTRVASAEMLDVAGRRVAMATGSAFVVPGGVEHLLDGGSPHDIHPPVRSHDE